MRLDGRRQSSNVDDRRGMSAGRATGMGIGGLIVMGLIIWAMGGNPLSVLSQADGPLLGGGGAQTTSQHLRKRLLQSSQRRFSPAQKISGLRYSESRLERSMNRQEWYSLPIACKQVAEVQQVQ